MIKYSDSFVYEEKVGAADMWRSWRTENLTKICDEGDKGWVKAAREWAFPKGYSTETDSTR